MEAAVVIAIVAAALAAGWYFAPKGWRTVALNSVMAILAVLAEVLNFAIGFDWKQVLPPEYAPWAVLAVNVANIALRSVTTTPVGKKV